MIDIVKKIECCGCNGCESICPKKCIKMKSDNEGFWYPLVDKSKCINCGLCEKVCPFINNLKKEEFKPKVYACNSNNEKIRLDSSSGGVFALLCESVINNNGVVFGATFDEEFNVCHSYSETIEGCAKFRGSKYVQSSIGDTYKQAKDFLDSGRLVLFTGTQCQIKGLNLFLMKEYSNLISVDVICHGVPSPKVFKLYRESFIKKYNSKIKHIRFRDKSKGWKKFSYVNEFENNNKYTKTLEEDIFMKGFLQNLYLRPSCYKCKAKNFTDNSDMSLADYWGVQNIHNGIDDDKGTSLVIVNSVKGEKVLNNLSNSMMMIESDLDYAIKYNHSIVNSVEYNNKRKKFFKELKEKNVEFIILKYTKVTLIDKIKAKIKTKINKNIVK